MKEIREDSILMQNHWKGIILRILQRVQQESKYRELKGSNSTHWTLDTYTNQIKDTGRDITLHRRRHPQFYDRGHLAIWAQQLWLHKKQTLLWNGHIYTPEHINSDCTKSNHPTVRWDKGQVKTGVPNEMIVVWSILKLMVLLKVQIGYLQHIV